MFKRYPRLALARNLRRADIVEGPKAKRRSPRDARKHRYIENAYRKDRIRRRRPKQGRYQDRDDQRRKSKNHIIGAHDHIIQHPAPARRRPKAQRHAKDHADRHRQNGHRDRHARADHQHRRDIAPQMIRAQPMRAAWADHPVLNVHTVHNVRRPDKRHQCRKTGEHHQNAPHPQLPRHSHA